MREGKMMRAGQFFCSALLGGGDLLSHFRSTIGAVRLNFSVRNGKRWIPHAVVTLSFFFSWRPRSRGPVWLEGRYTEAALALNNL